MYTLNNINTIKTVCIIKKSLSKSVKGNEVKYVVVVNVMVIMVLCLLCLIHLQQLKQCCSSFVPAAVTENKVLYCESNTAKSKDHKDQTKALVGLFSEEDNHIKSYPAAPLKSRRTKPNRLFIFKLSVEIPPLRGPRLFSKLGSPPGLRTSGK